MFPTPYINPCVLSFGDFAFQARSTSLGPPPCQSSHTSTWPAPPSRQPSLPPRVAPAHECPLSHPAVLGDPLLTSTHPRAGAIPTPSGSRLLLMTQVSKAAHWRGSWSSGYGAGFLSPPHPAAALLLQIKPPQLPQTRTQPGPPTTHTTTSSPQARCPAPPLPPRPRPHRASPLSPRPLASQTTRKPGKSITRRSVSVPAASGARGRGAGVRPGPRAVL